jgi:hypothetical protein
MKIMKKKKILVQVSNGMQFLHGFFFKIIFYLKKNYLKKN